MDKITLTSDELRAHLGKVLKAAASGNQVTIITYYGIPTAAIVPISGSFGRAIDRLEEK